MQFSSLYPKNPEVLVERLDRDDMLSTLTNKQCMRLSHDGDAAPTIHPILRNTLMRSSRRGRNAPKPGPAFEVTRRLLALNSPNSSPFVEVILLSKNSPDLSLRAFRSFEHHHIPVKHGSFTSGRSVAPFLKAWNIDLFLSNDDGDVRSAVTAGIAAARLGLNPSSVDDDPSDEVRLAFDGDCVIFHEESDLLFRAEGLSPYLEHERENALVPMERGPFGKTFLPKLAQLRDHYMRPDGVSRVRIALVTARNAPAHERVIHTFRSWGTPADEAHFVGRHEKAPILKATRAHIYFDDQEKHIQGASLVVPAGLVPGPHSPEKTILPA